MALQKQEGPTREIDMASFCADKVRFFSLSVAAPPYSRDVNAQVLGLDVANSEKVARVIKDGRRAITLPKERHDEFKAIRTLAAQTLKRFSIPFPFVHDGASAVPVHRIDELWAEMDQCFQRFEDTKKKLIADLPTVRDAQRAEWVAAAAEVHRAREGRDTDGQPTPVAEFEGRYLSAFDRAFPSEETIDKEYVFDFRAMGAFKRKISLMSREEFLKDEQAQAKLRVLQASEKKLQEDFFEWAGQMAAQTRTKLLEALYPAMEALKGGNSVGKREIAGIQKHLEEVRNANIFGDAKFEDLAGEIQTAIDNLKSQQTEAEKKSAEEQLKAAGALVEDATRNLKFEPATYRRLELDGDETHVFTDAEVCARITERMRADLEETVKRCAAVGDTDEQRSDNERRLKIRLGLQADVEAGAIPAEAAAIVEGAALQASTIDTAPAAPAKARRRAKAVAGIEIGDGPLAPTAPEAPVPVAGLEI